MRAHVMNQEAVVRKEWAARGGAATREFSDVDLLGVYAKWSARHGRDRGARRAAAAHFNVTETAIGKRLKKIRTN